MVVSKRAYEWECNHGHTRRQQCYVDCRAPGRQADERMRGPDVGDARRGQHPVDEEGC
ncbi:hypothetical protein Atai01_29900 [Amycolatopsis taiwanensis]|uniref:Uncharacterized protein n=1 Tax=Amycolatopsis taiwanensis TaxID=342230 RepID=A0A9W6QYJ0_9PSEU|nr:hypothetical protein Atai01_29900 [Amycolatopsis taiwanensis]